MNGRLLLALMLGVFMGALDNAILAPALPAIAEDLNTGVDRITLAFSIYSVFYAVAVPILGRLSDLLGYGRIYGLSMALFAGGSALAALSQSLEVLVFARVVQAVGAGGFSPWPRPSWGWWPPRSGGAPTWARSSGSSPWGTCWGRTSAGSSWSGPPGTGSSGSTCPSGSSGCSSSLGPPAPALGPGQAGPRGRGARGPDLREPGPRHPGPGAPRGAGLPLLAHRGLFLLAGSRGSPWSSTRGGTPPPSWTCAWPSPLPSCPFGWCPPWWATPSWGASSSPPSTARWPSPSPPSPPGPSSTPWPWP